MALRGQLIGSAGQARRLGGAIGSAVIPDVAIVLAGYVLAHAAWSVSDLPEGELLVPLAIVEANSQRRLTRFEAETQAEAIEQGSKYVLAQQSSAGSWALAREGQMKSSTGSVDVIAVEAWAIGMNEPITFIQPFQPFASGAFKLLGPVVPVVAGAMLDETASQPYLESLYRGVASHSKAAALWAGWQQ